MYQGQYVDIETGLAYNWFRYYDPSIENYISQDPVGLVGNNPTFYGYVKDVNSWADVFGLSCKKIVIGEGMPRVKAHAKKIDAKWYQAWGKNFPPNRKMTPDEFSAALKRNERWIRQKIKEGYEIIDIGLDPSRATRSPFYELEQKIINEAIANGINVNITRI